MTRFTVNQQPVHYLIDPETPLLWALRDVSNLTGTKYGCDDGSCSACTVDIDGVATPSCQITIAEAEGREITTIEGLSPDRSHALQQAWIEEQVPQCGFCQSGMIIAAAALLKRNSAPSDEDINAIPNLCRCGTYPRIRKAIKLAAQIQSGSAQASDAPLTGINPIQAAEEVPALKQPEQR